MVFWIQGYHIRSRLVAFLEWSSVNLSNLWPYPLFQSTIPFVYHSYRKPATYFWLQFRSLLFSNQRFIPCSLYNYFFTQSKALATATWQLYCPSMHLIALLTLSSGPKTRKMSREFAAHEGQQSTPENCLYVKTVVTQLITKNEEFRRPRWWRIPQLEQRTGIWKQEQEEIFAPQHISNLQPGWQTRTHAKLYLPILGKEWEASE